MRTEWLVPCTLYVKSRILKSVGMNTFGDGRCSLGSIAAVCQSWSDQDDISFTYFLKTAYHFTPPYVHLKVILSALKWFLTKSTISRTEWGWMSSYYLQKLVVNTFYRISSPIPRFCVRCFPFKVFWRPEDPVPNYYTTNSRTMANVRDEHIFLISCSKK